MSATRATTGCSGSDYLILPTGSRPPVPARLKLRAGRYSLWTLPGAGGVLHAGTIVGHLTANRTDIGTRTLPVLHSDLAQHERYEQVRFDQSGSRVPARFSPSSTLPAPRRSAGTVVAQADHLTAGSAAATVAMGRPGVVVLSASFDPGLDRDRRRTLTAHGDGRARPGRDHRASRNPSGRLPLHRVSRLFAAVHDQRGDAARAALRSTRALSRRCARQAPSAPPRLAPTACRRYLWRFFLAGLRSVGARLQLNSAVPSRSPSGHPLGEGWEEPHDLSASNSCTQLGAAAWYAGKLVTAARWRRARATVVVRRDRDVAGELQGARNVLLWAVDVTPLHRCRAPWAMIRSRPSGRRTRLRVGTYTPLG